MIATGRINLCYSRSEQSSRIKEHSGLFNRVQGSISQNLVVAVEHLVPLEYLLG